eukprot:g13769.t1
MALHLASRNSQVVELLLDAKAPLAAKDLNQQTVLHFAARAGATETLALLLKRWMADEKITSQGSRVYGGPLDWRDRWHRTPLHWAVLNGHVAASKALLSARANADPPKVRAYRHERSTTLRPRGCLSRRMQFLTDLKKAAKGEREKEFSFDEDGEKGKADKWLEKINSMSKKIQSVPTQAREKMQKMREPKDEEKAAWGAPVAGEPAFSEVKAAPKAHGREGGKKRAADANAAAAAAAASLEDSPRQKSGSPAVRQFQLQRMTSSEDSAHAQTFLQSLTSQPDIGRIGYFEEAEQEKAKAATWWSGCDPKEDPDVQNWSRSASSETIQSDANAESQFAPICKDLKTPLRMSQIDFESLQKGGTVVAKPLESIAEAFGVHCRAPEERKPKKGKKPVKSRPVPVAKDCLQGKELRI